MRAAKACIGIFCALALAALAPRLAAQSAAKHPIAFDDLISLHRISEPQVSPDGRWVAYTVATPDLEANHSERNIWLVAADGKSAAQQLTRSGHDSQPQWSPDGKRLAFLSSRAGEDEIFVIEMDGGEARQLTHISTGADNLHWSPDGKTLAFTSSVYPDCKDDACNRNRAEERGKSKVKARIYDHLLYRHWTRWSDGTHSHLFVVPAEGGEAHDLTPGAEYDVPPDQRGGREDIAFSPDSKELCFTAVIAPMEAISTNGDLFVVPGDGSAAPKRITTNPAFDGTPAYSPDGHWIAYRAQMVAGYESDRWRLMLFERSTGNHFNLTEEFDRSPEDFVWSADSKTLYFTAEDEAESPIFAMEARENAKPKKIVPEGSNRALSLGGNGHTLVFARASMAVPAEVFAVDPAAGGVRQLTHQNAARMAELEMNRPEPFWFEGAEGARVEGLLLRPPNFDAAKKYPMLLLVHGGPQGAWNDSWSYRWNPEVFAAPGYVAVMINPRGSTGYGQKFCDEIQDDWGGKVYEDLMKGVDYVLAHYSFVDGDRMAAAGGSYGGYMMDWFAGHTGRFKALISHAGPYDKVSMYGATEELWFEEHDMKGTPWTNPESYHKWSPSTYAVEFGKYKTPTLVIGGEMDYRVPYTQDLQFFTALQRQGVPSKLVIFPDEGHWILKPQNSRLWHQEFLGWLAKYLK